MFNQITAVSAYNQCAVALKGDTIDLCGKVGCLYPAKFWTGTQALCSCCISHESHEEVSELDQPVRDVDDMVGLMSALVEIGALYTAHMAEK